MADAQSATRAAREEEFKRRKDQSDKDYAAQQKRNAERMALDAAQKPTPTPEEIRSAVAGKNVDVKEDHGAPEQDPVTGKPVVKAASGEGQDASYKTRAAQPAQPAKKE